MSSCPAMTTSTRPPSHRRKALRVAFVCIESADDRRAFSGLTWYIRRMLERQGLELRFADGLSMPARRPRRLLQLFLRHSLGFNYLPERSAVVRAAYARQVEERLSGCEYDLILSPGTLPVSRLGGNKPVVIWTDATFAALENYYWDFSRLVLGSSREGHRAELEAFRRCSLAVFSSDWASQSAISTYGLPRALSRTIPFGINLECSQTEASVRALLARKSKGPLKLLHVGADWRRKGGDRVLELGALLTSLGIPVEIDLVGGRPRVTPPPYVRTHGFISKASTEGRQRLERLYAEASFLILPTLAECAAVSIAEAASFAVPSLTTAVGGNASMMQDGVSGFLVKPGAPASDYLAPLLALLKDPAAYQRCGLAAYADFHARFTWERAAERLMPLLEDLA